MANASQFVAYLLFGFLASALNIGSQAISFYFMGRDTQDVFIAMVVGTAVGFVFKYYVDKKVIFKHTSITVSMEGVVALKYTLFSILTTLVYILFEMFAHTYFEHCCKEEVGAALGLLVGYIIKYYLDKHYTFINKAPVHG